MLRKLMLVLCIFFSGFALSDDLLEELSVKHCKTNLPHDSSEYFLISKEHFELLKSQPAGSLADATETLKAISKLPFIKVDIDQEAVLAFWELEIPVPSICRQLDFSTLGYGGVNFIFSKFSVNNLAELKHHSLAIAKIPKWPDAPKKASNVTTPGGDFLRAIITGGAGYMIFTALGIPHPAVLGYLAFFWCGCAPNKCYDVFDFLSDVSY